MSRARTAAGMMVALLVAACASQDTARGPNMTADEGRARVAALLPAGVADRAGWATDIYAALVALDQTATVENVCSVVAIVEQESSFRTDPPVPGLAGIAAREIERQRERSGIPRFVVDAALSISSTDGKSYRERLETVTTERELSEIFEDFIARVPLGPGLLADRNPIRTGGPMQVSIAFAEQYLMSRPYPYPIPTNVRREVFTRRGGLYFGIAHLLDYEAPYESPLYRFGDFNAGRYASRNAAFQQALTLITGIPLALDGDLLRYGAAVTAREAGATERAARSLGPRIGLDADAVRRDLEKSRAPAFERTVLYRRVFELADQAARAPVSRAVVPRILLRSPKITRPLTTEWFANRVAARYRRCTTHAAS